MFKKGDKVYSILRGWGEVIDEDTIDKVTPMLVKFERGDCVGYPYNGKRCSEDLIPELYHTEPTITVPKRRVEHKGWICILDESKQYSYRECSKIYPSKELAENRIYGIEKGALQEITYYTEE